MYRNDIATVGAESSVVIPTPPVGAYPLPGPSQVVDDRYVWDSGMVPSSAPQRETEQPSGSLPHTSACALGFGRPLAGHGPVYNLNDRVEVGTSTIWLGLVWLGRVLVPGSETGQVMVVLGTALTVNQSLVTLAQGEVVKRLAGWAALLAAPTLVASWYGMNFDAMPELHGKYSYLVLIGIVATVVATLYAYLKKIRWL